MQNGRVTEQKHYKIIYKYVYRFLLQIIRNKVE